MEPDRFTIRPRTMQLGSTHILDTFSEAFRMRFVRMIVTAVDDYWLDAAVREVVGYSSSVIGCDAEIGVEQYLAKSDTPDGRTGVALLAFGFSAEALATAIPNRVGQCIMTCPTTAIYDGLPDSGEKIPLGKHLRYFGDGFQRSKLLGGHRYWRVPVMDGEFILSEKLGVSKGVAGGNIILQGTTLEVTLGAARGASEAILPLSGVVTPFPGGVVRSGSKVGSTYKGMKASTNDAYCPTLRGRVESELVDGANCAYEIVIDGVAEGAVAATMRTAIETAAGEGILAIGAGNYGGKLGKFHFHLRELME